MIENHQNQDGCIGATITIGYSASGQDGPADSTPTTTAVGGTTTTLSAPSTGTTTTTTTTAPFVPPSAKAPTITLTPPTQSIAAGAKATFKVTVENTTGVKLTGVKVKDATVSNCARNLGTMSAAASQSYSCSLVKAKKPFQTSAIVSGKTPAGSTVSASAGAKVEVAALTPPANPAIAIRVTPGSQTLITKVGMHGTSTGATTVKVTYPSAHFKIKVTNTGEVSLGAVRVGDLLARPCARSLGTLAPHASRTYSCVRQAVTAGFTNVAVASGKDSEGTKVTARGHARIKVKTSTGATVTKTSSGVTVTKSKSGKVVTLSVPDVLFAFNESTLGPNATRPLMTVLKLVTVNYKTGHLTITGYTDDVGSVAYNLDLSKRRATTVATWLEQHGVPAGRVTIAFEGKADPIASNATAQGRAKNRRVTITIRRGT